MCGSRDCLQHLSGFLHLPATASQLIYGFDHS